MCYYDRDVLFVINILCPPQGDGQLTTEEIQDFVDNHEQGKFVRQIMEKIHAKTAADLVKIFDTDGDGQVSRDEFLIAAKEPNLEDLYSSIDVDGDGQVTVEELQRFLDTAPNAWRVKEIMNKCEVETVADFVRLMDEDGDGQLSRSEFRNLARNPRTQAMFQDASAAAVPEETEEQIAEDTPVAAVEAGEIATASASSPASVFSPPPVDRPEASLNFPVRTEEVRVSDLLAGKAVTFDQMVKDYKTSGFPMNKRQLEEHWNMLKLEVGLGGCWFFFVDLVGRERRDKTLIYSIIFR